MWQKLFCKLSGILILLLLVWPGSANAQCSGCKMLTSAQETKVSGIAENAKGGAVIISKQKHPIYIDGLDSWPAEALKKKVVARGKLVEKKILPSPEEHPQSGIAAGAYGSQMVLENARWHVK